VPEARECLIARLAELDALHSGQDARLRLQVSEGELIEGNVAEARGHWAAWKGWVALMTTSCIVGLGILLFMQPGQPRGTSADSNASEYLDQQIKALFKNWNWQIDVQPAPERAALRKRFFDFLTQDACELASGSEHPDAKFWARLPRHAPESLPKVNDLVDGLHPELKKLARKIAVASYPVLDSKDNLTLDQRWRELPDLFKVIGEGMDYRRWLENGKWNVEESSSTINQKFPWDEESPAKVRKMIVAHFLRRQQNAGNLRKEDVLTMVKQLNAWQVKGVQEDDAEDRPWFVCDCYLAYLSQSRFGKLPDEPSWYVAFVSRLPMTPSINMADRECKKDFTKDALLPLARRLEMEPSDLILTSTLLTDIADRLDYEAWHKECDDQIESCAKELSKDLTSGPRNCRKMMGEYEIAPYGTVKIEVARDAQDMPMPPTIQKNKLEERSKNSAINDFVERFRPRGTVQKDKAPDQ
jgi:hypothetical protein